MAVIFADFKQLENLVLLTLDRLSCFSDGCFLDDWGVIRKKYLSLICARCSWQSAIFYIIICQNFFLPVHTRISYLYAFVCTNIYHLTTKLQLKTLNKLRGSAAEWIKHGTSGMLTCREKSSNPVKGRFFITQASQT